MPADLTFAQLGAALPAGSVVEDATEGIMLKVSAISGDEISEDTDTGVVETLFKLLRAANTAQVTVNTDVPIGERLAAFPAPIASTPTLNAEGQLRARLTHQLVADMPVDINETVGPQN